MKILHISPSKVNLKTYTKAVTLASLLTIPPLYSCAEGTQEDKFIKEVFVNKTKEAEQENTPITNKVLRNAKLNKKSTQLQKELIAKEKEFMILSLSYKAIQGDESARKDLLTVLREDNYDTEITWGGMFLGALTGAFLGPYGGPILLGGYIYSEISKNCELSEAIEPTKEKEIIARMKVLEIEIKNIKQELRNIKTEILK